MSTQSLTVHDYYLIAGTARVDYRTAQRFLEGKRKPPVIMQESIARAAAELGYELPTWLELPDEVAS